MHEQPGRICPPVVFVAAVLPGRGNSAMALVIENPVRGQPRERNIPGHLDRGQQTRPLGCRKPMGPQRGTLVFASTTLRLA
jgi:hypothetical protein